MSSWFCKVIGQTTEARRRDLVRQVPDLIFTGECRSSDAEGQTVHYSLSLSARLEVSIHWRHAKHDQLILEGRKRPGYGGILVAHRVCSTVGGRGVNGSEGPDDIHLARD